MYSGLCNICTYCDPRKNVALKTPSGIVYIVCVIASRKLHAWTILVQ